MRKFNEKKSKWWGRRGIGILSLRRRWPIWGVGCTICTWICKVKLKGTSAGEHRAGDGALAGKVYIR